MAGLLRDIVKEARWTKHLPPQMRAKSDYITALRSYEKAKRKGKIPAKELTERQIRLHDLEDFLGGEQKHLPRVGGTKGQRFSELEKLLGADDPMLKAYQRPQVRPNLGPKTPLKEGFPAFLEGLKTRASDARTFASKHRKPLLYAGAGAGALGLGLLGLLALNKRKQLGLSDNKVDKN